MSEDVDAMLEAPYSDHEDEDKRSGGSNSRSPSPERSSRKKKKHKKRSNRSRSRSRSHSKSRSPGSRSRSRSRSKERRRARSDRDRSRDRGRKSRRHNYHSRSRSRSRSKDRDRRRYSDYRGRDRGRDYDHYRHRGRYHSRYSDRDRRSWRSRSRSPEKPPPSPSPEPRDTGPELSEEEKDKRTVFCMQLAQRVTGKDLEEFLGPAGKIRNVKMITDKNSRRPKGIAYVEFVEIESVANALKLNGQKLFGVPIMIQPTMAEKNRAAANAENLKKAEGPKKLYVGNLHPNINEIMLKAVFEPFGRVEQVKIQKEQDGTSKGYGFIEFKSSDIAENAMKHLNGFELANQPIRVNYVNERSDDMETLDSEDMDIGIGMSASSRASLMAKLSEGHNAGLKVPGMQSIAAVASCLVLKHMFNPHKENGVGWSQEIRDDVIGEAAKFGSVYHIHVDATSPEGCVYLKCQSPQVAAAVVNALNGRKYAGNIIVAQLMPDSQYHGIFPMAISATIPLMASTH